MPETSAPPPGDALLRLGAVLVAVGVVASLVTLVPFLTGADPLPLAAYLLALLAPLGLGVVLVALWRRARGRRGRLDAAATATTYRGSDDRPEPR